MTIVVASFNFNSFMGRLKAFPLKGKAEPEPNFNSFMGRLKE